MKLKQLYTKVKSKCIKTVNKARSLKQKLSHDNLFDISFGAILAIIGLMLYKNLDVHKLIIIVVPFLFSWFNELINMWQGAKFRFVEIGLRCIIATLLYFII